MIEIREILRCGCGWRGGDCGRWPGYPDAFLGTKDLIASPGGTPDGARRLLKALAVKTSYLVCAAASFASAMR